MLIKWRVVDTQSLLVKKRPLHLARIWKASLSRFFLAPVLGKRDPEASQRSRSNLSSRDSASHRDLVLRMSLCRESLPSPSGTRFLLSHSMTRTGKTKKLSAYKTINQKQGNPTMAHARCCCRAKTHHLGFWCCWCASSLQTFSEAMASPLKAHAPSLTQPVASTCI